VNGTPALKTTRLLVVVSTVTLAMLALAGCGRKGPLELPPEVQARGEMLKAQEQAQGKIRGGKGKEAASTATPEPASAPAFMAPSEQQPIPGTTGHRPPAQYPFPLDPLL